MEQQFFNNMSEKVVDDLRKTVVAGSRLSIAAASFSLYAFETLKNEFCDFVGGLILDLFGFNIDRTCKMSEVKKQILN